MKTLFKIIIAFLMVSKVFSAELKIEVFGSDNYFKYDVSETQKFFVWSNNAVFLTDIGINGSVECKGILEIIDSISSSNIMCKWTETNGDNFYAQFFVNRGSVDQDATVQKFEFLSGEGRWEEMVGQKCLGAYTPLIENKFMWQGKCEMPDKTFERVKNYKKPE